MAVGVGSHGGAPGHAAVPIQTDHGNGTRSRGGSVATVNYRHERGGHASLPCRRRRHPRPVGVSGGPNRADGPVGPDGRRLGQCGEASAESPGSLLRVTMAAGSSHGAGAGRLARFGGPPSSWAGRSGSRPGAVPPAGGSTPSGFNGVVGPGENRPLDDRLAEPRSRLPEVARAKAYCQRGRPSWRMASNNRMASGSVPCKSRNPAVNPAGVRSGPSLVSSDRVAWEQA